MLTKNYTDYEYDVFISYSRSLVISPWVNKYLYPLLQAWLNQNLGGRRARIFVDQQEMDSGVRWPQSLRDALLTSKCLVPVLSGDYFYRPWCVSEWSNFIERENVLGLNATPETLIVPVVFNDGESFFDEAKTYLMNFDFKDCRSASPNFEKSEKFFVFEEKVERLAEVIANKLKTIPNFNPKWPVIEFEANEPTIPLGSRI